MGRIKPVRICRVCSVRIDDEAPNWCPDPYTAACRAYDTLYAAGQLKPVHRECHQKAHEAVRNLTVGVPSKGGMGVYQPNMPKRKPNPNFNVSVPRSVWDMNDED
jgi:hypothetical protein